MAATCVGSGAMAQPSAGDSAAAPADSPARAAAPDAQADSNGIYEALLAAQRDPTEPNLVAVQQLLEQSRSRFTEQDLPELIFFQARLDEFHDRFDDAERGYQRYLQASQGGRYLRIAHQRLRRLDSEEAASTGSDATSRLWEQFLASYVTLDSTAALEQALTLLEQAQNPILKADIQIWLAHEHHFTRDEPRQAWHYYHLAAQTPSLDSNRANAAISGLTTVSGRAGTLWKTYRFLDEWFAANPGVIVGIEEHTIREELADQLGNTLALRASFVLLPALMLWFLLRRGWRAFTPTALKQWRPWKPLGFIAWMFGASAVMGYVWQPANGVPILACAPAVMLVYLLTGAISRSGPPAGPRAASILALLSVLSTLAAMYVALLLAGRTAFLGL
jgi:hypothetical protein